MLISITDFFPEFCGLLQELSTRANEKLDACEKARASFFSVVVLYKIKVNSMKLIREDKIINLNVDTNFEPESTKLSALFHSGVYFNYPFEVCPPEVLDSLFSFSLSFEGQDKKDSLTNLQALNGLLEKFKASDCAKQLETDYNIFILPEGLKNHLIFSLKINEKYKDLLKKLKTVFPIDQYFLSFLAKCSLSYAIKWNEYNNNYDSAQIARTLEKPHLTCNLTLKNYEIINELFATYLKMTKLMGKAEGTTESSIEDQSDWNITHLILFLQAFKSLSFDFKMLLSEEIPNLFYNSLERGVCFLLENKIIAASFLDAFKIKTEKCEINCIIPILMMKLNISLLYQGMKEFLNKKSEEKTLNKLLLE